MAGQNQGPTGKRREHLGIHFRCCHVYGYIYKNKMGTAYCGFCPKCMKRIVVRISKDGTGSGQRVFQTN